MTGCGGVIVGDAEGDEGMGEGGAGVRMVESREALSCAIELKWNLSIHPSVSSFKSPGYQAQAQSISQRCMVQGNQGAKILKRKDDLRENN